MKLAMAVWNDRISPLFDSSRQVRVFDVEDGKVVRTVEHGIETEDAARRAVRLAELGVEVLLCGAVSRPLLDGIAAKGIRVVPFVAGAADRVLAAFLAGRLQGPGWALPGCRGGRGFGAGPRGGGGCRRRRGRAW
ncbi:MAG: hypothetical protein MUC63_09200 [Planctomycetes bacterium]|jgi:predicted Fe-Mo cluster-binding NifX family protein|nr:hypothetical protein [Planctomycetota bacterium]